MPEFDKPDFQYDYVVSSQIQALREHRQTRAIPAKSQSRSLLATWNIANFGAQERRPKDLELIAEILSWFDLVALQEVRDNLGDLRQVLSSLPASYRVLFSDPGGNDERYAFLYDANKISLLEEVGLITVPRSSLRHVKLPGITTKFEGFDRNPYLAAFDVSGLTMLLANVHLYFGDEGKKIGMDRRCLEAFAVARWAGLRHKDPDAITPNILALGDFNLPKREPTDPVFAALTKRGLKLPEHSTKVGSNIRNDKQYDQMAVFPGPLESAVGEPGVFDFDSAIFRGLWGPSKEQREMFFGYVQYYISDHRPLWAELRPSDV